LTKIAAATETYTKNLLGAWRGTTSPPHLQFASYSVDPYKLNIWDSLAAQELWTVHLPHDPSRWAPARETALYDWLYTCTSHCHSQ